jgi:acylphosphatase
MMQENEMKKEDEIKKNSNASAGASNDRNPVIRKRIRVYGSVQGVGFRYRTENAAESVGATGWVRNELDGSVLMEIQGTEEQIDQVLTLVNRGTYVNIERLEAKTIPLVEDEYGFVTRGSGGSFFDLFR